MFEGVPLVLNSSLTNFQNSNIRRPVDNHLDRSVLFRKTDAESLFCPGFLDFLADHQIQHAPHIFGIEKWVALTRVGRTNLQEWLVSARPLDTIAGIAQG